MTMGYLPDTCLMVIDALWRKRRATSRGFILAKSLTCTTPRAIDSRIRSRCRELIHGYSIPNYVDVQWALG
jgi:hypothetical protein